MSHHKSTTVLITLMLSLVAIMSLNSYAADKPNEKVTLQLKWMHQFQFAGYYAAKEKGYYQEAGLDVSFIEGSPSTDVMQEVQAGHADYGTGTSEIILAHYHGAPFVVLGVIFQHSPVKLVTLASSGIDNVHKLAGRNIMIETGSAELFAYLQQEGLPAKKFTQAPLSSKLDDFIAGKVDAMLIYDTDESFVLQTMHQDYYQFSPRMSGIDFYGDNLFTTEQQLKNNPKQVEAFRAASMRGWQYALNNQEEIARLIYDKYSQRHTLDHLRFEAKAMCNLMQPELIMPGYMNEGRWQHIVQTYHQLGLLPKHIDVSKMLYFPDHQAEVAKLREHLFISITALASALLLALLIGYVYRRVRATANRLDTLFQYAPISMIVISEENKILQWNREAEKTFGWSEAEVLGKNVLELLVPPASTVQVETIFSGVKSKGVTLDSENMNRRKDGSMILCEWLNTPFKNANNDGGYILCMAKDITEKKQIQAKIERLAHFDSLTELPNRATFFDRVNQTLSIAKREKSGFALLFIDLDGFKAVNDTHGHEIGDSLLKISAQRMQECVRESDTLGRIGGDEFVLLLSTSIENEQDAQPVADKIHAAMFRPFMINELSITIGCSIGIAIYPEHGNDSTSLAHYADIAMYQEKIRHKAAKQTERS